jgi:hypothetical protein
MGVLINDTAGTEIFGLEEEDWDLPTIPFYHGDLALEVSGGGARATRQYLIPGDNYTVLQRWCARALGYPLMVTETVGGAQVSRMRRRLPQTIEFWLFSKACG